MLTGSASAAGTDTWAGTTNSNWSTATNWDTAPVSGDDIVITQTDPNGPTNFDLGAFTANSLVLNTANNTTTSFSGGYFINNGTLTLGSGGITDNAANAAADHINTNLALTGPTSITLSSGATGLTIGGNITGTGPVTVTDNSASGIVTFTGTDTYTGGTTISAGTLQLGSGSTTGSIVGDVVDNGALAIDHSNTFTFGGAISGSGALSQIGGGTTILTGNNTYTDGTTISAGALQIGNGSTTGSIVGNVTDNTSLVFDRSNAYTFSGSILGSGSVTQNGTGTLTLSGTSLYSGGTTINGGIVSVSADATLGAPTGGIAINNGSELQVTSGFTTTRDIVLGSGTQIIDVAASPNPTFIVSGTISGTGGLDKTSAGLLALTSNNTYTGGTTISAGSLSLGATTGSSTGMVLGNIVDNSSLIFNRTDASLTYANVISGTGSVMKSQSGTLVLTSDNTYTGGTVVQGGTLQLGNGGTTGSVTGIADTVDINGAITAVGKGILLGDASTSVVFDHSDDISYVDDIFGAGSLVKQGTNTLTLTGFDLYSGGTTISAGTLQIGNGGVTGAITGAVVDSGALVFDRSNTFNFTGAISGSGTFSQIGTGTTVMTGANTYTGGTTISAGTLQLGIGGTTGSIAGDVTDNSVLAFDHSDTLSFGGVISGSGAVNQVGGGTTVLSGTNTYTGGTNIQHGALSVSSDSNLGTGGTIAMSPGTTLDVTATGTFTHAVTVAGDPTFNIAPATTTTWNGVISDGASAGTIEVDGGGTLVLGAANTYTGGTQVRGGSTLSIAADTALGGSAGGLTLGDASTSGTLAVTSGFTLDAGRTVTLDVGGGTINTAALQTFGVTQIIGGSGALTVAGPGTLALSGANNYAGGTTISAGTLQIGNGGTTGSIVGDVVDNSVLAFDRSDVSSFNGIISGTGAVDQIGSGTTILTAANTYSGGTNIEAGTLSVSSDGNLGTGGTIAMSAGSTLKVTATGTFAHAVTVAGDPTFNIAPSTTTTWNGVISDGASAGTVEVTGGGTLVLGAANTYTGGTAVHGGSTLSIANDGALGGSSGSLTLGDAGTSGTLAVTSGFTLGAGRVVTLAAGGGTVNTAALQTFNVTQGIGGSGALTVAGPGKLTLSGTNTYSGGTTISAGTLQIGVGGAAGSIVGNVVDNSVLAFDRSDTLTFGGVVSGTGAVNQIGAGTTVLTGANTYSGGTTISAGTLQVGDGGTIGSIAGNVLDNSVLAFDRSDTLTFGGAISGTGVVDQIGTGTTVLTGASTYSGGTTISAGTLQIGNGGAFGSIVGNVVDNSAITFDRSNTLTYAGVVSGSGDLNQIGGGTTILTGANSYTGATTISAGTLQIGNGGTSGSFVGNGSIVDNGALAVDHSDSVTLADLISGSGAVNQIGAGTTILTGADVYSGGTTITSGILQIGNGGTAGSIFGDVVDNAVLAFDRSDTISFGGVISGAGAVDQSGSGTTILTGANTYSGGTTISTGTLQIGDGGTTGSIAGDVVDNSVLAVDHSDSVTLAGAISGSGSLDQIGSGTTILTGAGSFIGGTTIAAGTLQLGNGGTTGSIAGDVVDDGTLAFDRSNALTFAGIISGTGGVHQFGSGDLTLSGANTYSGSTVVDNGALLLAGSIANSSVAVNSGGTFGGGGHLADLTVASGGTVSPGVGGVGTLNVGGNLSLASGATYFYDVTPATNDLLSVSGTATLGGTLVVNASATVTPGSTVYHVVDSTGSLSGTFSLVTLAAGSPANLLPDMTYGPNDATLRFLPSISSLVSSGGPLTAGGGNTGQVAGAIDFAIIHDGGTVFLPLASLTPDQLATTLSQMTGEVGVGIQNAAVHSTASFLETMLDPLLGGRGDVAGGALSMAASLSPARYARNGASDSDSTMRSPARTMTFWASGGGEADQTDGNSTLGTHKSTASEVGGDFGFDYALGAGNGALGLAVGFGQDNWKLNQDLGKGNASFYQLGAYYSQRFATNYYVDAAYTYTHDQVTTDRSLDFGGINSYRADFDATTQAARFEFGRVFAIDRREALVPYLRFQADDVATPNYAETTVAGSPLFALSFTRRNHFDYTTELGTAWDKVLSSDGDSLTDLRARLGWLHDYANPLADTATFSAFSGASFNVSGVSPARDAAHVVLGIEHDFGPLALTLDTEGSLASQAQSYGGEASVSYRW